MFSPTPSSGHFSAGSAMSSKSPAGAAADPADSVMARLRREIDQLRRKFSSAERDWAAERGGLLLELQQNSQEQPDLEQLRLERERLATIEQQISEILAILKSLNSMVRPKA